MLEHAHALPAAPKRIVVVGASGFLGKQTMTALAASNTPAIPLGSSEVDLASDRGAAALAERLAEGDTVLFLSALTPDKGRDSATLLKNLAMARAVAAAVKAAKAAHLVYASSDAVYSFATALISEDTPSAPTDLYGIMHRARELVLLAEAGVPTAILRFTAIYGIGDTHNSYGPNRFARQAKAQARITLGGEGEETRDHLFIDDAVAVLLGVVSHGSAGVLNVASGKSRTFRAVADAIVAIRPGVDVVPSPRQSPVTHRHFDATSMIEAFPSLRFTALEKGLALLLRE